MQISIKPELQQFIEKEVSAGHFKSAEEVVEAALARLMSEPDESEEFSPERLAAIRRSNDQIDRGEGIPFEIAAAELRRKHLGT